MAATPQVLQESELYGYCCGQAVNMGPVMPAAQFWVTDEAGNYLCVARALTFEGSVLTYNPAQNEAEWVLVRGLANDLTPGEERSAIALTNYVLWVTREVVRIARLGASQIVNWPSESSTTTDEGVEEELTMDTERGEETKGKLATPDQEEVEGPWRDWVTATQEVKAEGAMGELQQVLAMPPHIPGHESSHVLSSPMEAAVEVHVEEADLDTL